MEGEKGRRASPCLRVPASPLRRFARSVSPNVPLRFTRFRAKLRTLFLSPAGNQAQYLSKSFAEANACYEDCFAQKALMTFSLT